MRVEDIIFFSPNFKTAYLNLDDDNELISAFVDRIEGFYFKPAEKLNEEFESFAKGLIVLTAIDFIGEFLIRTNNSDRIKRFCLGLNSIKKEDEKEAKKLVDILNNDYRNGLVHEGRIKNLGQFFNGIEALIVVGEGNSMVNPQILLNETRDRFYEYIEMIKQSKEELFQFRNKIKQRFEDEIKALPE
ncbi:hypothetical protein FVB32_14165 [Flagellimonas hymeniacidonis]|uniref:Apea-like HEPN domain-containing protein n=1 Tax=Flagellimonas hymeniacidonis TaxID=2603628 RepID=A0A5C8V2E2_9FLAO|nr:hypothetical protein [Flagellimonas hymeniacidonis]TXN35714.1 hypothetical protein FVB32_14165 [Flagellimonas hymeniacidonis]